MKIITATTAKDISNNFLNNACGSVIEKTMNEILLKAEQGGHRVQMLIPTNWDCETRENVAMFFGKLGYDVTVYSTAMRITW
jgi:hypothetical protein